MTASSLALTIEKQDTYELQLQQPQLKEHRRQVSFFTVLSCGVRSSLWHFSLETTMLSGDRLLTL